jgi:hypothetical protein
LDVALLLVYVLALSKYFAMEMMLIWHLCKPKLIVRCLPSSHGTFFSMKLWVNQHCNGEGGPKQGKLKGKEILVSDGSGGSSSGAGGIMISRTGEPLSSSEQYGSICMKNNHFC